MTFDEWFLSKQGEPYDSMYMFARDAWAASAAQAKEDAATVAQPMYGLHGVKIAMAIRSSERKGS